MKTFFYLVIIGLLAISCKDRTQEDNAYNPQLPAVTTTGANTFGCKINGIVMIPRNSIGYVPPGSNHYAAHYSNENGNYSYETLSASDSRDTKRGGLYIYIQGNPNYNKPVPIGQEPIYNGIIPQNPDFNDNYKTYILLIYNNSFYTSIENTGSIEILRSDSNILSAKFSCKAKNTKDSNDIIEITEGRFDFDKNTIGITNFP